MALELLEDKETEVDVITVLKAILSVRDESFDVILKHYIAQATILVENHTCRSITNKNGVIRAIIIFYIYQDQRFKK